MTGKTENALRLTPESPLYRQIIENTQEGVWVVDDRGRTVAANNRLATILGCTTPEVEAGTLDTLLGQPGRGALAARLDECRRGTAQKFEMPVTRRDGTHIWTQVEAHLLSASDSVPLVRIALLDITKRRSAEEDLREREAQWVQAQEISQIRRWEWDPVTDRVDASPALDGDFPTMEAVQQRIIPADRPRFVAALRRGLESDAPFEMEFHIRLADGAERTLHMRAKRERDLFAGRFHIVGATQDITERRRLEERLQQAERVSSMGRLAASVAHEFNNVLMGIQPFADLLARRSKDAMVTNAAAQIADVVARGKRITQALLRFTRSAEPATVTLDVTEWMRNMEPELAQLAGPNVELRTEIDPQLKILGDPHQLRQVLTNLVVNARDAMANGGRIVISATADGGYGHFAVRDTGSGIPSDILHFVFEPLFTTKKSGGTGLGLAIANQIVQRHGGEIWAESVVGEGSTFHFRIPTTDQPSAQPASSRDTATSGVERLAIIEDDENVGRGLVAVLSAMGIEVDWIRTGAEAEPRIAERMPDVVILDVDLPDMSGVTVYRRLVSRWPALPVLFSTGHEDERLMAELRRLSNVAYLHKPYDLETLLAKVEELRTRATASYAPARS